jgi:hypothetical protein
VKIVNGFTCRTQCDVALAKKGIDPAHPHDPPGTTRRASSATAASDAPDKTSTSQPLGENAPAASGSVGTVLSTFA